MSRFINDKAKELKISGLGKFFELASQIKDSISLSVGEPDFDTPYNISNEAIKAIEKGNTFYSQSRGLNELVEEISIYNKRMYNINYNKDEILTTVGASEAIDLIARVTLESGDEVIIPTPCYVSYAPCVTLQGANVVYYPLSSEENFKINPSKLKEYITPKTKMLILNFPNNPTGAILEKDILEDISKIVIEHDILVVSDEIYAELTYDKKHISIASIPNMKERTLVLNGFSKAFSMTGWRLGYILGPKEIVDRLLILHQYSVMSASTISQYAGIEALRNGDDAVKEMRETYKMRRNYVVNRLHSMGISCHMPEGAFYVFADIKKFGLTSEEFCLKLLYTEKIVVIPGNSFGDSGEGFIRISYAYSFNDLQHALNKIETFINNIKKTIPLSKS